MFLKRKKYRDLDGVITTHIYIYIYIDAIIMYCCFCICGS